MIMLAISARSSSRAYPIEPKGSGLNRGQGALNNLTKSGFFPDKKTVSSANELWRKAHMVYYQSPFAYDP
jgi:hypothetical protein